MQDNNSIQTQQNEVLKYLKQGNSITNKDAVMLFDAYRLGDIIHRLRNKGHNIDTRLVQNRHNHQKHAVYTLLREVEVAP